MTIVTYYTTQETDELKFVAISDPCGDNELILHGAFELSNPPSVPKPKGKIYIGGMGMKEYAPSQIAFFMPDEKEYRDDADIRKAFEEWAKWEFGYGGNKVIVIGY